MQGFQHGVQHVESVVGPGGVQRGDRVDGLTANGDRGVDVPGDRVGTGQFRQVQRPRSGVVGTEVIHGVTQQGHRPAGGAQVLVV